MQIRKRLIFYGHVQGVGFRFRTLQLAGILGLTGSVRNNYEGSVTVVAQGEEDNIDIMKRALQEDGYISVSHVEEEKLSVVKEEKHFRILS